MLKGGLSCLKGGGGFCHVKQRSLMCVCGGVCHVKGRFLMSKGWWWGSVMLKGGLSFLRGVGGGCLSC